MAYKQLPVRSDIPAYEFETELEGVLYTFDFRWNDRDACWTMDILDAAGVILLCGIKIHTGYPLLRQYTLEGLPKGELFCFDTAGQNLSPVVDTFGDRVILVYRESTTVDEA